MMLLSRRWFGALAAGVIAMPAVASAAGEGVREPIVALYEGLERMMRMGRTTPFLQRFDSLAPVVDRSFDLETILQVSIGLRWAGLDETARSTLRAAFRRFTVASYVANFDKYEGERFEILPNVRPSTGGNEIVQTRIVASSGEPIKLDYVLHKGDAGWKVVDILLDGTISRVAVQRSDFRSLLGRGDPAPLIESLQRKTADLSGGALS